MSLRSVLEPLHELASEQWGLFTAAQAAQRGVTRLQLSRLANDGLLDRVRQGVYRAAGAPSDEFEVLRAEWLAADPTAGAAARLAHAEKGAVVCGESATRLHDIGDLRALQCEFTMPTRRQSSRPDVRFCRRSLEKSDVTLRHGLPVTTVERTLADLLASRTDTTQVSAALADAMRQGSVDLQDLSERCGPLASRYGLASGDGGAVVQRLLETAELDEASMARRLSEIDVGGIFVQDLHALEQFRQQAAAMARAVGEHSAMIEAAAAVRADLEGMIGGSQAVDALKDQIESFNRAYRPAMEAAEAMQRQIEAITGALGGSEWAQQAQQSHGLQWSERWHRSAQYLAPLQDAALEAARFQRELEKRSALAARPVDEGGGSAGE